MATGFSGWGFIGSPGATYAYGTIEIFANYFYAPAITFGVLLFANYMRKQAAKHGGLTIPHYLASTHRGTSNQKIGSLFCRPGHLCLPFSLYDRSNQGGRSYSIGMAWYQPIGRIFDTIGSCCYIHNARRIIGCCCHRYNYVYGDVDSLNSCICSNHKGYSYGTIAF